MENSTKSNDRSQVVLASLDAEKSIDSIDWSQYPPDRVEGLKLFYKGPSSDEDGPATESELKMICLKWHCQVDMRIDNFLYWFMRKAFRNRFKSNKERFQRYIPKIFNVLERRGLESYTQYQQEYTNKNNEFRRKGFEWRQRELRRIRYLDKLQAVCSKWSWSDDESDESENDEADDLSIITDVSSVETVVNRSDARFADYLETESDNIFLSQNPTQEEALPNTQTFIPETTSTQN